jgi:hypothetical protein
MALPVIAVAVFLLWKEYDRYYGKSPITGLPDVAQLPLLPISKPAKTDTSLADRGRAKDLTPKGRSAEQTAVITRAKSTPATSLDSSLPNEPIEDWMERAAGSSASIQWQVNDCGDLARQPGSLPLCAQANIDFSDGTKFQALMLMGSRALKTHSVQFTDPSLMWAVYAKAGSDDFTPAPLSSLQRVAATAQ